MILAKKIRLYPTTEQEQKLWQSANTARFIYNWTLSKQEENHENGGKFISDEVSNTVAKQSVKDACNAYKNFFKSLANKPKFKSKKKSKPSFYNDVAKLKVKPK
ncbi:MAG: helix-turn-helix domain-containing protein, partial [Clostridium sp.]|nr:helix-turn-helix domain-containing protein [Clostridium sp.]